MDDRQLADLVPQASFIFAGTVLDPTGSSMDFPIDAPTSVVRIDEILRAPADLGQQVGGAVTLVQPEAKSRRRGGRRAVFFTNGWLYGESIAVVEVGRMPVTGEARSRRSRNEILDSVAEDEERPLAERLAAAELVVTGRVVALTQLESGDQGSSEHDPEWWEATVEVGTVLKGTSGAKRVGVTFAASRDVAWFRAPKMRAGERGVWLIHRGVGPERKALGVIDPLDAHPSESEVIDRIVRLLPLER